MHRGLDAFAERLALSLVAGLRYTGVIRYALRFADLSFLNLVRYRAAIPPNGAPDHNEVRVAATLMWEERVRAPEVIVYTLYALHSPLAVRDPAGVSVAAGRIREGRDRLVAYQAGLKSAANDLVAFMRERDDPASHPVSVDRTPFHLVGDVNGLIQKLVKDSPGWLEGDDVDVIDFGASVARLHGDSYHAVPLGLIRPILRHFALLGSVLSLWPEAVRERVALFLAARAGNREGAASSLNLPMGWTVGPAPFGEKLSRDRVKEHRICVKVAVSNLDSLDVIYCYGGGSSAAISFPAALSPASFEHVIAYLEGLIKARCESSLANAGAHSARASATIARSAGRDLAKIVNSRLSACGDALSRDYVDRARALFDLVAEATAASPNVSKPVDGAAWREETYSVAFGAPACGGCTLAAGALLEVCPRVLVCRVANALVSPTPTPTTPVSTSAMPTPGILAWVYGAATPALSEAFTEAFVGAFVDARPPLHSVTAADRMGQIYSPRAWMLLLVALITLATGVTPALEAASWAGGDEADLVGAARAARRTTGVIGVRVPVSEEFGLVGAARAARRAAEVIGVRVFDLYDVSVHRYSEETRKWFIQVLVCAAPLFAAEMRAFGEALDAAAASPELQARITGGQLTCYWAIAHGSASRSEPLARLKAFHRNGLAPPAALAELERNMLLFR